MEISQQDRLIPDKPNRKENILNNSFLWEEENFFDSQNINNETILNNIYGNEIFSIVDKLSKLKDNSCSYLEITKEDLKTKYEIFNKEILKYINITTNKLINAFEFDITNINEQKSKLIHNFAAEKINILNKILSFHTQIFEVIQQNVIILQNFLQIFELLDKEQPIHDFFTNEFEHILKSWLFLKLDLEKFNFKNVIDDINLNQNYKDFIIKECQEKNSVMNIIFPDIDLNEKKPDKIKEKYKKYIKTISENMSHLVKLNMANVPNVDDYFGKLKLGKLKHFNLIKSILNNNFIFKKLPSLTKLKIKYCPLLDMSIFTYINNIQLKKLILDKNGFVNGDFENILSNYILKAPNLLNNLELLSLSCNNISKIDFTLYLTLPKHTFHELKALILDRNKLYKIVLSKEFFPELKFIDCCNNNLTKNYFVELDKKYNDLIILQSANFFLLEKELCEEYYTSLKNKLHDINNLLVMQKLNLSYLPTNFGQVFFKQLNINYLVLIKLKKLNLSYNGLNCKTFFSFIEKNKKCINLKSLNLIGNNLDDTFFEKYLKLGLNKIFSNLQNLYLNDNQIGGPSSINYTDDNPIKNTEKKNDIFKLRLMYKFILENKNLKILTITKNPIREKYIIKYESDNNAENNDEYIKKDNEGKIIINDFYSFLIKIKNELLNRDNNKKNRKGFNIIFDCLYDINLNSEDYPYSEQPIVFI